MPLSLITLCVAILWALSAVVLFYRERNVSKAPLPSCNFSTLLIAIACWFLASMAASGQLDVTKAYNCFRQVIAPKWLPFLPYESAQGQKVLKQLFLESILGIIWISLLRYDKQITTKGAGLYAIAYLPVWVTFLTGSFFLSDQICYLITGHPLFITDASLYALPKAIDLIHLCLLAPFIEEVFFRGWLLTWLSQSLKPWIANTLVTLLFTAMHLPSYSNEGMLGAFQNLLQLKYVLLAYTSLIFGACYLQNRSLTLVVILHASYNAFALWMSDFSRSGHV